MKIGINLCCFFKFRTYSLSHANRFPHHSDRSDANNKGGLFLEKISENFPISPYFWRFLILTLSSSTTLKCPYQSSRRAIAIKTFSATIALEGALIRNKMMPVVAGNCERKANSPKSLSKVKRIRFSAWARLNTWGSEMPGESILRLHRVRFVSKLQQHQGGSFR